MYSKLKEILDQAYDQAANGKGAERHADGEPFERQPIMAITKSVGIGFPAGQAMKKIQEAVGAHEEHPDRAIRDLLGAINYTAAVILHIQEKEAAGLTGPKHTPENYKPIINPVGNKRTYS